MSILFYERALLEFNEWKEKRTHFEKKKTLLNISKQRMPEILLFASRHWSNCILLCCKTILLSQIALGNSIFKSASLLATIIGRLRVALQSLRKISHMNWQWCTLARCYLDVFLQFVCIHFILLLLILSSLWNFWMRSQAK